MDAAVVDILGSETLDPDLATAGTRHHLSFGVECGDTTTVTANNTAAPPYFQSKTVSGVDVRDTNK